MPAGRGRGLPVTGIFPVVVYGLDARVPQTHMLNPSLQGDGFEGRALGSSLALDVVLGGGCAHDGISALVRRVARKRSSSAV